MNALTYIGAWIILLYLAKIIFSRMMRKPVPVVVEKPVRKYKVAKGGKRK